MLLLPWLQIHSFHSICIGRGMEEVLLRGRTREAPFHFSLVCFPRAHLDTSEVTQRHQLENMASNSSPSCWGPSHYAGSPFDSHADAPGRFLGWREPTFITRSSQREDQGADESWSTSHQTGSMIFWESQMMLCNTGNNVHMQCLISIVMLIRGHLCRITLFKTRREQRHHRFLNLMWNSKNILWEENWWCFLVSDYFGSTEGLYVNSGLLCKKHDFRNI